MDVMMSVTKPELSNPKKLAVWQGDFQAKLIELTLQAKFKRMTVFPTCLTEIMFDQTSDPAKLALMETWVQQPAV